MSNVAGNRFLFITLIFWMFFVLDICWALDATKFDKTQEEISDRISLFSNRIDRFFSGKRSQYEESHSHILWRPGITFPLRNTTFTHHEFNLRLELPNTQRRLNLVVQNVSQSLSESISNSKTTPSTIRNRDESSEFALSLRYFLFSSKNWNSSIETGVRLAWPPDPFAQVRARRLWLPQKGWFRQWSLRATGSVYYFSSFGFGHRQSFEFEKRLSKPWLFNQFNTWSWTAEDSINRIDHGYSFYQTLSPRAVLSYTLAAGFQDQPAWMTLNYTAQIRYRKKLYKSWLFGEIIPEVNWSRSENFGPQPAISFFLEVLFGGQKERS